jgi:hypothetical protein
MQFIPIMSFIFLRYFIFSFIFHIFCGILCSFLKCIHTILWRYLVIYVLHILFYTCVRTAKI